MSLHCDPYWVCDIEVNGIQKCALWYLYFCLNTLHWFKATYARFS